MGDRPGGWLPGERALWLACGALVVAGVVLRVQDLGFPAELTFDERHFVNNARRYLEGEADRNNHPPLGKLLVAASMALLGDHAVGWRVPSLLAGLGSIAAAGGLGRALFADRRAGALAAAVVAADGFLLAYARTALLDGVLTFLFLASAWALVRARGAAGVAVGAALAGAASAVKFSGVVLVVPVVIAAARVGGPAWGAGLAMPVVYVGAFAAGLAVSGRPWGPGAVVAASRELLEVHLALTDWENRWTSRWYTWWLPERPITLRWTKVDGGQVRAMTSLGNLAVQWGMLGVLLGAAVRAVRAGPRAVGAALLGRGEGGGWAWCLLLWALPIVPWTLSNRDSYHYHYLPAYAFGAVAVGGALAAAWRSRPRWAWAGLGLVATVFVGYAPVHAQLPITREWWRTLMFVEGWR